jgi:hypothetical protein
MAGLRPEEFAVTIVPMNLSVTEHRVLYTYSVASQRLWPCRISRRPIGKTIF